MQDLFPLFSVNFGDRLRWLRKRRGLSQSTLGDGSASTASDWEKNTMPRGDKWVGIAERLGLSWGFISTGNPATEADFGFVRENRNLIDFRDAPSGLEDRISPQAPTWPDLAESALAEDQAPYGTPAQIRREIARRHADLLDVAGDDVARLGWILIQTQTHLTPPAEWRQAKTEAAPKKPLVVKAPAHQQNPIQPGSRSDSARGAA